MAQEADLAVQGCEANILESRAFIRDLQVHGTVDQVLQGDAAMVRLQHALERSKFEAKNRHRAAAEAKAPWIDARKAARGIEKLHERALEDQRIERLHKEDKALEASLEALLVRQKNTETTTLSA